MTAAALDRGKLTAWGILVSLLVLLGYASRAAGGKPAKDVAYRYSTAASGLIQYAIILAVVLAIARPQWWRCVTSPGRCSPGSGSR